MKNEIYSTARRLVWLAISLGFFYFSYALDAVRRLAGKRAPGFCVVLYYHAIPAEQRELFSKQMDILVRMAKTISAESRTPLDAGERYAAVTFDDGFESVFEVALPELEKRNIPATVFVIAGVMGRSTGWDGYPERVISIERLGQLPENLLTIGSHTMTHPNLSLLSELAVRAELLESRQKLEEVLHRKVTLFSFPYGALDPKMFRWCREAGYERIFTTLPYLALRDPQEFVTGRVWTDPTDWPLEFRLKLLGAYRWVPFALSWKRKLIRPRSSQAKSSGSLGEGHKAEASSSTSEN